MHPGCVASCPVYLAEPKPPVLCGSWSTDWKCQRANCREQIPDCRAPESFVFTRRGWRELCQPLPEEIAGLHMPCVNNMLLLQQLSSSVPPMCCNLCATSPAPTRGFPAGSLLPHHTAVLTKTTTCKKTTCDLIKPRSRSEPLCVYQGDGPKIGPWMGSRLTHKCLSECQRPLRAGKLGICFQLQEIAIISARRSSRVTRSIPLFLCLFLYLFSDGIVRGRVPHPKQPRACLVIMATPA